MKTKKMKKLVLTKSTISNLENRKMTDIKGGVNFDIINPTFVRPDGKSCEIVCPPGVPRTEACTNTCDPTLGDGVCPFCPA